MSKQLQNPNKVVESLQNLRDELWVRASYDLTAKEICFKINSCLFDQYPVHGQQEMPLTNEVKEDEND